MTTSMQEIAERMIGQDERATADAIFVVQQRRRIYGLNLEWCDKVAWLYDGEEVASSEEELAAWLKDNEMTEEDAEASGLLVKTGCQDMWVFVQPFFSERGAEAYVRANAHRLTDPRVYVDSAHRNHEWQAVRTALCRMTSRRKARKDDELERRSAD